MKKSNLCIRIIMYFVGMFIMTLGISMAVKSDLGVAPVSSIPYTITCIWGMEMGKATMLFYVVLVLIQILMLRKNFKWKNLLQVIIGVVFGYFTTFSNYLFSYLPTPENLVIRIIMILGSTFFIAVGLFFYLPADLVPLAPDGLTHNISKVSKIEFGKVKVVFDVSLVTVSLIACLIALHTPGSVGIGTVVAAFLVGTIVGLLNKLFGAKRDALLK